MPASHLRDHENAYVSLNGKTCWTKTDIQYTKGDGNVCGNTNANYSEERYSAACKVTLSGSDTMPLTVRVFANLDSDANDESFGIDNVIIQKIESGAS